MGSSSLMCLVIKPSKDGMAFIRSAGRSCPFIIPLSRDPTSDSIDIDFFLFLLGPYYAEYPKDSIIVGSYEISHERWESLHEPTLNVLSKEMFKDPWVFKIVVDQFPTLGEMVWIEALSDEWLAEKMSILHYLMMSHGGIDDGLDRTERGYQGRCLGEVVS
nr:hypothetical protein [Tanacetum cinerariifolium]